MLFKSTNILIMTTSVIRTCQTQQLKDWPQKKSRLQPKTPWSPLNLYPFQVSRIVPRSPWMVAALVPEILVLY